MKASLAGLGGFFLLLWSVAPWPLMRAAAAAAALFLLLGFLWSWILSRGLAAGVETPRLRTFSGRRTDVHTKLENRSPLPSGVLFVSDSSGGLETWGQTRRFAEVGPFSRLRFSFAVRGRERGLRTLGPLVVSGADPTGLFPFTRRAEPRSLVVYPPIRPVRGWPQGGLPSGSRHWEAALTDDLSRFRAFRPFRPGDSLAAVSAAAWARGGEPLVRTYERTVERPTGVVVDLRSWLYPLKLRWALVEAAVDTAASLIWDLLGAGETVWLSVIDAQGEDRPALLGPGRGWASARPFLERLALASVEKSDAGSHEAVLPPGRLRILWVGPQRAGAVQVRPGDELIRFPIGEGSGHGAIVHP